MFGFGKKKKEKAAYDSTQWKPAMRCSICTGERTAGFRSLMTGQFREECLIRNDQELKEFMDKYDILDEDNIEKFY